MTETEATEEVRRALEELIKLHEKTSSDPARCREFNSSASLFLSQLEEMGCDRLADRMMDILAGCSPKDFSHCDNNLLTKSALERLREAIKEARD
jgi:hypothetical protein